VLQEKDNQVELTNLPAYRSPRKVMPKADKIHGGGKLSYNKDSGEGERENQTEGLVDVARFERNGRPTERGGTGEREIRKGLGQVNGLKK